MNIKFKCGTILPSACVPYTGKDLSFLDTDEQPECDANINDVFSLISDAIRDIEDSIDLTEHTSECLTFTQPLKVRTVLQAHDDKICTLSAELDALQDQFDALNISNELITIDLGCMASAASQCQVQTNTYTLISILTLFKNRICAIEAELDL